MADHEGWYRVAQPDLVAAGLSRNADPKNLRLFGEAIEQPMLVTGADGTRFGPNAAIEFYATGMDTPFTGTRAYWLTAGDQPGLRISSFNELPSGTNYPRQFMQTVELRQRTTYFAALINPNDDNFFGALVSTTPVDQILATPHASTTANAAARLDVVLQGVGEGVPHDVTVALNGLTLGHIAFSSQSKGKMRADLPQGLLLESNTVTLTAQDGDTDISLVDHITITYPHTFAADGNQIMLSARAGAAVQIAEFQETSVRIFDISNENDPKLVSVSTMPDGPRTERNPGHEEPTGIMETTVTNLPQHKGAFAESMCGGVIYYTPDITAKAPKWREVFDDTAAAKQIEALTQLRQEMLQDLIRAAVNEASRRVDDELANQMKSLTGSIPGIPGMKIPGLF